MQPNTSLEEIMSVVYATNPDATSFDLEASQTLYTFFDSTVSPYGLSFYQQCIANTILHCEPIWAKLMTLGREKFIKKLSRDEVSIFRGAGLLLDPPDDHVVYWWDNITGQVRLELDNKMLERAREAEKLSIEYERKNLLSVGIDQAPRWIAIEDNTAGYDVLSYTRNNYGLVNKLIEVKSTISRPSSFYLTRNEWEQAAKYGDSYVFHIWDMRNSPPQLFIKTVDEVSPHVPNDNSSGKWKNAEILIT